MTVFASRAEAMAAYQASTDYDAGSGDVAKAASLQSVCRYLRSCPEEAEHGEGRTRLVMPVAKLRRVLEGVWAWGDKGGESN